jgi:hypothetical protein
MSTIVSFLVTEVSSPVLNWWFRDTNVTGNE